MHGNMLITCSTRIEKRSFSKQCGRFGTGRISPPATPPQRSSSLISGKLPEYWERLCCPKVTLPIPRLSQAGMPSRSEGWGGTQREPDRAKPESPFEDRAPHPSRILLEVDYAAYSIASPSFNSKPRPGRSGSGYKAPFTG